MPRHRLKPAGALPQDHSSVSCSFTSVDLRALRTVLFPAMITLLYPPCVLYNLGLDVVPVVGGNAVPLCTIHGVLLTLKTGRRGTKKGWRTSCQARQRNSWKVQ